MDLVYWLKKNFWKKTKFLRNDLKKIKWIVGLKMIYLNYYIMQIKSKIIWQLKDVLINMS